MIIIPAIDLKDGCCVRLRQGRADDSKTYSEEPVAMAKHWENEGARLLHIVDLDGAFKGQPTHMAVIEAIAGAIDIPVEVGGGLRTDEDIRKLLDCGVQRAIIGTRAFTEPEALKKLAAEFAEHLVIGIDARDGMVQVKGWVETTNIKAVDLASDASKLGVKTIIYTDTSTDGMMKGTNVEAVNEICEAVQCDVIASGGITSPDDVKALTALRQPNLAGAIVGKALYEQTTSLKELQDII